MHCLGPGILSQGQVEGRARGRSRTRLCHDIWESPYRKKPDSKRSLPTDRGRREISPAGRVRKHSDSSNILPRWLLAADPRVVDPIHSGLAGNGKGGRLPSAEAWSTAASAGDGNKKRPSLTAPSSMRHARAARPWFSSLSQSRAHRSSNSVRTFSAASTLPDRR